MRADLGNFSGPESGMGAQGIIEFQQLELKRRTAAVENQHFHFRSDQTRAVVGEQGCSRDAFLS
jgi:hypothetical protein